MVKWLPYPMVRFAFIWISGLAVGFAFPFPKVYNTWLIVAIIFSWVLLVLLKAPKWQQWLIVMMATFTLGLLKSQGAWKELPALWDAPGYWGRVEEVNSTNSGGFAIRFRLMGLIEEPEIPTGRYYIQAYSKSLNPTPGTRLLVLEAPQKIPPPMNPWEFNYRKYMLSKGVVARHWWSAEQVVVVDSTQLSLPWFHHMRTKLLDHLRLQEGSKGQDAPALQILRAMLLGNRSSMDTEVRQAFARSGTMHLLVVSGLHLGILYLAMLKLCSFFRPGKWAKWVLGLAVLGALWTFALLTGMGTATTRAALMFTLLHLGRLSQRQGSSYNSLAIAALLLLNVQPTMLFSVGFQFSFAALLGIFLIQPRLMLWYNPKQRIVRYIWELITVSISAQLAVGPLVLFYFQQVSWYFLLGNLLTVPIATLILILGMAYFVISWSQWPAFLKVLYYLADLCYSLNRWIEALPGSVTDNFWISILGLMFIYMLILSLFLISTKNIKWGVRLAMVVFLAWYLYKLPTNTNDLVVYHLPGATAVDMRTPSNQFRYTHSASSYQLKHQVSPAHRQIGGRPQIIDLEKGQGDNDIQMWRFMGNLVFLINGSQIEQVQSVECDYLVLTAARMEEVESKLATLCTSWLIIDGSNRSEDWDALHQRLVDLSIKVHITPLQGAFIHKVNPK